MKKIFLAPRSNETSYENFESTILSGRTYSFFEPYLSEEEKKLLVGQEKITVWGCQESMRSRWKNMEPDHFVLFYDSGSFTYSARVLFIKHSEDLGRKLWPADKKTGNIWPCLFFVKNLKEISIPIKVIQELAEYESGWDRVQGFMPMREEGIRAIETKFGSIEEFLNQKPEVYEAINKIIAANKDEIVEEEVEEDYKIIDTASLLRDASEFVNSKDGYVLSTAQRKVRVESKSQKRRIALLENYSCQICNWSVEWMNSKKKKCRRIDIDHIKDKSEGGTEELNNLWALCPNCHVKKTLGVITVDLKRKKVFENGMQIQLHHDNHLNWK
jgi:hypothetical protein